MKEILLSLSALFAVSIASAQSYISQPDPSTYEVKQYKANKKAETAPAATAQPEATTTPATEQPATAKPERKEPKRIDQFSTATATTEPAKEAVTTEDKKVAQNRKK